MFKRAILAVKNRIKQNAILLFIMFIIASLILASLSINKASDEAVDYARESLGAEITLIPDMEALRNNMQIDMNGTSGRMKIEKPDIYLSDVTNLMESEYAIDSKYKVTTMAIPVDFDIVESDTNDEMANMKRMMMGDMVTFEVSNAFSLLDSVIDGEVKLLQGEGYNEDSEKSVVISEDLATTNDFSIGDTLSVNNQDEESIEYEIIGIYESYLDNDEGNTIYTNFSSINQISSELYNDGDYIISGASIYLNDPANAEKFIEQGSDLIPDLESRNLILDFNSNSYETMVGPIESVGDFSMTILYIVVIAGIVIISLLVYGFINARNYEIGVLLSLGETKTKIIAQFIIELLIIFIIAGLLTVLTSSYVSTAIGDNLLESQLSMTEESNENPFNGRRQMFGMQQADEDIETIDEIDVNVSATEYGYLLISGLFIIFVSMLIPIINIFKYSPKEILSRKE